MKIFHINFISFFSGIIYGLLSMIIAPFIIFMINNYLQLLSLDSIYFKITGSTFIILGGITLLYSTFLFVSSGKGSPLPFDPPKDLVTKGIYTYTRNPMYVASAFIWIGEFLFFGSILLLFYALAWIVLNHLFLIYVDEKSLTKRFGERYITYKKRVPRYL